MCPRRRLVWLQHAGCGTICDAVVRLASSSRCLGGIDSCATATMVFSMCRQVVQAVSQGNQQVIKDVRRICGEPEDSKWLPSSPQDVCSRLFHTCFMGTTNSSKETRARAKELAMHIGAYHVDLNIDTVVTALTNLFSVVTNFRPRFKVHGGSSTENLALQNIQARLRMVTALPHRPTPANSTGSGATVARS